MLEFDISSILKELAIRHPIFHSEADFRVEFALYLHGNRSPYFPICEYPIQRSAKEAFDIMLMEGGEEKIAIELKYFCQAFSDTVKGEHFELKYNTASDVGCHGVLKDVMRLEKFIGQNPKAQAHVIVLTNCPIFWEGPRNWCNKEKRQVNYKSFVIKCGRTIKKGKLDWASKTSPKIRHAYQTICLKSDYTMQWQEYSDHTQHGVDCKFERFRFLHIQVK